MTDFHNAPRIVRLRKPQRCDCCKRQMAVDEPAWTASGRYDGDMYRIHMHPECAAAEIDFNDMFDLWGEDYCRLDDAWGIMNFHALNEWLFRRHPIALHYRFPKLYGEFDDALAQEARP